MQQQLVRKSHKFQGEREEVYVKIWKKEREREKKNYNCIITSKNPQTKCLCIGKIQKKTFLHFKFHCYTFEPNRFNKNQ